jgi:tetratricopeptide (TPR) repeat protein
MADTTLLDNEYFQTTDGEIAAANLNSARLRSWSRLDQDPLRAGAAEAVLEYEQLTAQYVGDLSALDRMETLAERLVQLDSCSARTALIQAQVASALHRFSDARHYLAQATLGGAPSADVKRISLSIDQACGLHLEEVLDERRRIVARSGRFEERVALGALLADIGEFNDADETYRQGLREFQDVSPFPVAWVCFQLGMLWGEVVPEPQLARAEHWYRKATVSLPCYVRARVHLAEILSATGRTSEAEATLRPALASGDPEASWRLADVLHAEGIVTESALYLQAARSGFKELLGKHLLAFADHGAEFYIGSGGEPLRALELAQLNLENRPTLRAYEQTHAIALEAGETDSANEISVAATRRWGNTLAFQSSSFAQDALETGKGAAA